jgi:hypothetical protein
VDLNGSWAQTVQNAAPIRAADGSKWFMYFTGTPTPAGWGLSPAGIAVATADNPEGPYTVVPAATPIVNMESEDPSVFIDPRGHYHMYAMRLCACACACACACVCMCVYRSVSVHARMSATALLPFGSAAACSAARLPRCCRARLGHTCACVRAAGSPTSTTATGGARRCVWVGVLVFWGWAWGCLWSQRKEGGALALSLQLLALCVLCVV